MGLTVSMIVLGVATAVGVIGGSIWLYNQDESTQNRVFATCAYTSARNAWQDNGRMGVEPTPRQYDRIYGVPHYN